MSFAIGCSSWRSNHLFKLYPNDELGGCLAGDPDRRGRLNNFAVRPTQVPVFGAVIVANAIVARFVKDPTEPRFIWRAVPIQLVGLRAVDYRQSAVTARLAVVGAGHQFVCVFGIGLIFLTLFRFLRCFPITYRKGTVSASLNMVILMVMSVSVEIGRWLWFNGGRLPFHLLASRGGRYRRFHPGRIALIACANIRLPSWRRSGDFARSCRQALFLTL